MENESFNIEGVQSAMSSLEEHFTSFAETLADANGYIETIINVGEDSAVFGDYGSKLQNIWDQNYVTFDNFHKNFESWSEVVALISANNADFTVGAEAVYRDNAGTLDGIQGARTAISKSKGRDKVDISSIDDEDVKNVLGFASKYKVESGDNNTETITRNDGTTLVYYKDDKGKLLYSEDTDDTGRMVVKDKDGNVLYYYSKHDGKYYDKDGTTVITKEDAENIKKQKIIKVEKDLDTGRNIFKDLDDNVLYTREESDKGTVTFRDKNGNVIYKVEEHNGELHYTDKSGRRITQEEAENKLENAKKGIIEEDDSTNKKDTTTSDENESGSSNENETESSDTKSRSEQSTSEVKDNSSEQSENAIEDNAKKVDDASDSVSDTKSTNTEEENSDPLKNNERTSTDDSTTGKTSNEKSQDATNASTQSSENDSIYSINSTDAKGIRKDAEDLYNQFYSETENLCQYRDDLKVSKNALEANKDAYSSKEYEEKIKQYDSAINKLDNAIAKRNDCTEILISEKKALKSADTLDNDLQAQVIKENLEREISTVPSYQSVVESTAGSYQSLDAHKEETISNNESSYSQSMACSSYQNTNSKASQMTLENAYGVATHNKQTFTSSEQGVEFFNTSDYLKSAWNGSADVPLSSREYENLTMSAQTVTVGGKTYDSVAYVDPTTGERSFYSIDEWENINK